MMNERVQVFGAYLNEDHERATKLFGMDIEDAVAAINADGVDVTAEEYSAFIAALDNASKSELNENDLENVAGGVGALAIYAAGVIMYCGGWALQAYCRR